MAKLERSMPPVHHLSRQIERTTSFSSKSKRRTVADGKDATVRIRNEGVFSQMIMEHDKEEAVDVGGYCR